MPTNRLSGKVDKGWGYELIFATNDKYCGKILFFEKKGAKLYNLSQDSKVEHLEKITLNEFDEL